MGFILLIVESPAKCKKIEDLLGPGYKCIASFGHIRELQTKNGIKCIDVDNNYKPQFTIARGKYKTVNSLKDAIQKSDEVLLATDDDREGEAIAWHICKVCRLDPLTTKRIIFHEITKSALTRAVNNPTTIDMNKVNAQKARQVLDLLVGFTVSPLLWKQFSYNKKSPLSAGRCQTPALRLVYDNECDIKDNPGKACYDVKGDFTDKRIPFSLTSTLTSKEEAETFLEETVSHDHELTLTPVQSTHKSPPKPLTTSDLQQKASNVLHFSPKQTMASAQILYENGLITYMRTDSRTYSKEFIQSTKSHIISLYGEIYIHPNIDVYALRVSDNAQDNTNDTSRGKKTKASKKSKAGSKKKDGLAQEAHEAIRPTYISRSAIDEKGKITQREVRLYQLIHNTALMSCMAPSEYDTFNAFISAPQTKQYRHHCEQVTFQGWEIVQGKPIKNKLFPYLLSLEESHVSEDVPYKQVSAQYTLKERKQHYTEAKLIQLLEARGIGRPSTFSMLLSKIQERGYVTKEDVEGTRLSCVDYTLKGNEIEEVEQERVLGTERNKLVLQPMGRLVIEFLSTNFDSLFAYEYTKHMEDTLDNIARGSKIWYTLCDECYTAMQSITSNISLEKVKIDIDERTVYTIGRYGPIFIRTEEDGTKTTHPVKKDATLEDIRASSNIDEFISQPDERSLGVYENKQVVLKKGRFGLYAVFGEKNISLKKLKKKQNNISLDDVIPFLDESKQTGVLRSINENASLRTGKYGPYIMVKTKKMKKPKFIPLKKFPFDAETCEIETLEAFINDNM